MCETSGAGKHASVAVLALGISTAAFTCAGGPPVVPLQRRPLSVHGVAGILPHPPSPQFVLEVVSDPIGDIHVLTSLGPYRRDEEGYSSIRHYRFLDEHLESAAVIDALGAVLEIKATSPRPGEVYVLSALEPDQCIEKTAACSGLSDRLLLTAWTKGQWRVPQLIPEDRKARRTLLGKDDFDLTVDASGIDVFWVDWREGHFWTSILSGAQFRKAYHLRYEDGVWGRASRVQRRGTFDVGGVTASRGGSRGLELFWGQYSAKSHEVLGATLSEDGWTNRTVLFHSTKQGLIDEVAAARIPNSTSLAVTWIQDEDRRRAWASMQTDGQWTEPIMISADALWIKWVKRGDEGIGVLLQEQVQGGRRNAPLPLYYIPIDERGPDMNRKQIVATDSQEWLFGGAASHGRSYVFYVSTGSEEQRPELFVVAVEPDPCTTVPEQRE